MNDNFDLNLNKTEIEVNLGTNDIEIELPGGARGLKGDTGATGPKGDTGDKGDKGDSGVWVGNEEPSDPDYNVWIDPTGQGTEEQDPIFISSAAYGISNSDITTWNSKQAELVSGTNIKTINNQSLLGSGNITIQGGGGSSEWGQITGTLSDQTDLQTELNNKVDKYVIGTDQNNIEGTGTILNEGANIKLQSTPTGSETKDNYIDVSTGSVMLFSKDNTYTSYLYNYPGTLQFTGAREYNNTVTGSSGYFGNVLSLEYYYNSQRICRIFANSSGLSITGLVTPTTNDMAANKGYVDTGLSAKQATLVSGTNIKTINNETLLGSGNITTVQVSDSYSTSTTDAYSANYVNGLNTYSTDERRIGTWIDGKPLYQITKEYGELPNNALKQVAHNISNIKRAVDVRGYAYRSTDNISFTLPYAASTSAQAIALYVDNTNITIVTGNDRSDLTECYVTIRYTKTTD